jgi:hypothetical protein
LQLFGIECHGYHHNNIANSSGDLPDHGCLYGNATRYGRGHNIPSDHFDANHLCSKETAGEAVVVHALPGSSDHSYNAGDELWRIKRLDRPGSNAPGNNRENCLADGAIRR